MVLDLLLVKGVSVGLLYLSDLMASGLTQEEKQVHYLYKLHKTRELSFHYPSTYIVHEEEFPTASHFSFQEDNGSQQFMITLFKFMDSSTTCIEAARDIVEELKKQAKGSTVRIIEQNYNMKSLRPDYMASRKLVPQKKNQTPEGRRREKEREVEEAPCEIVVEFIHLDTKFRRRIVSFYLEDNLIIFQHTVPESQPKANVTYERSGSQQNLLKTQGIQIDNKIGNYLVKHIKIAESTFNGELYAYIRNFRFLLPSPLYRITAGGKANTEQDEDDKDYIIRASRRSPTNQLLEGFSVEPYFESTLNTPGNRKFDEMDFRTLDDIGMELAKIYDHGVQDLVIGTHNCKLVEYESESQTETNEDDFMFGEIVMETSSFNPETRMLMIRFFARRKRYPRMRRNLIQCLGQFTFSRNEKLANDFLLFHHSVQRFSLKIPRYMIIHDRATMNPCLTFSVGSSVTSVYVAENITETKIRFDQPLSQSNLVSSGGDDESEYQSDEVHDEDAEPLVQLTPTLQQNILHLIGRLRNANTRVRIMSSSSTQLLSFSKRQAFRVMYLVEQRAANGQIIGTSYLTTFVLGRPNTLFRIESSHPGMTLNPASAHIFKSIHHQFMVGVFDSPATPSTKSNLSTSKATNGKSAATKPVEPDALNNKVLNMKRVSKIEALQEAAEKVED